VASPKPTAVYLEIGSKRVFACAPAWPGWCRSAKDEDAALEALAAYAPRFAPVARAAGLSFGPRRGDHLEVIERVAGSATTDFGAPGAILGSDADPMGAAEARRCVALVGAAWDELDRVVAGAPARLRKGPRGGGRDRDAIARHVVEAEAAYARKLGFKDPAPDVGRGAALGVWRGRLAGALGDRTPSAPAGPWPPRYAARRIAWHALDHAWEIEDRADPAPR